MYVKKYENGICVNPITKDKPFLNQFRKEKLPKQRSMNNTKGFRCIVSKIGTMSFVKYHGVRQAIGNKQIEHLQLV